MANTVEYQRKDYTHALENWQLVSDAASGERAVKDKRDIYLPIPNPADDSDTNKKRYNQYLKRAVFYNATGRTVKGLVGAAFNKVPDVNVPTALEYIKTDADGAGVSIEQQAQGVLAEVLIKGRHALFVDYPITEKSASKADLAAGLVQATIIAVDAEKVVNWKTEKVGGTYKLTLVVILESVETPTEDGFGADSEPQYRALRLVSREGGGKVYTVEIYKKSADGVWESGGALMPKDAKGAPWDVIPFAFIGAQNNDTEIDSSPTYDLAVLNLAHYRNSADNEDSVFFTGQVQPWLSGLDEDWREFLQKQGVNIGSRSPILLPAGGAFGFAQASANTLVKGAMDQKEHQMIALGARLIERGQVAKTATESNHENNIQHSVLSLATTNVSAAYTKALGWAAQFMKADGEVSFGINQDFLERQLDAQMLQAIVAAWQADAIPSADMWARFRAYNLIDPEKDDETIRGQIDSNPPGLGLDD